LGFFEIFFRWDVDFGGKNWGGQVGLEDLGKIGKKKAVENGGKFAKNV
jgi:hypothetical protein